jgi:glycosyltransferase involved in cell wall biosynthesis
MTASPAISVLMTTHNPHPGRLGRTLQGLFEQTLPPERWELVIVDNASDPPVQASALGLDRLSSCNLIQETRLGIAFGRQAAILNSRAPLIVFVDDDTVLDPTYLEHTLKIFDRFPRLGVGGGKGVPEFEAGPPESWVAEFFPILAIRDFGDNEVVYKKSDPLVYPEFGPIGAGMVARRDAMILWTEAFAADPGLVGRKGTELTNADDLDIVIQLFRAGWEVGYFPKLVFTHLIPATRVTKEYLGRLEYGTAKSCIKLYSRHDLAKLAPVAQWTVSLRKWRAYFRHRAWAGSAEYVRWKRICGIFDGRVELGMEKKASGGHQ